MMSDDADDVDADGADDNVGDNDGVFFSPELAQDNGLAENKTRPRGHRKRHPGPPPEAGTPGHAFTMGSTGVPICQSPGGAGDGRFSTASPPAPWIRCAASSSRRQAVEGT